MKKDEVEITVDQAVNLMDDAKSWLVSDLTTVWSIITNQLNKDVENYVTELEIDETESALQNL